MAEKNATTIEQPKHTQQEIVSGSLRKANHQNDEQIKALNYLMRARIIHSPVSTIAWGVFLGFFVLPVLVILAIWGVLLLLGLSISAMNP